MRKNIKNGEYMRNIISTLTLVLAIIASSFAIADEVNVFNARHYLSLIHI